MAHFCLLDENNIVQRVEVVSNDVCQNEWEGQEFLKSLYGQDKVFKQTSYNGNIRKNYAGIGYTYDAGRDAFIAPQPFPSWTLNEETCRWESPTPMPQDGMMYSWDEPTLSWIVG
jgi:hypothetical protein